MKNKLLTVSLILILIGGLVFLISIFFEKTTDQKLISPEGKNILQTVSLQKTIPTLIPTPTPIQYNFNKSTDLKKELDNINPEVLDSDFSSLKSITSQL